MKSTTLKSRKGQASTQHWRAMNAQCEMFESVIAPSTSVIGLHVILPRLCHCGAITAVIGASVGPHYGSLRCPVCERHRGWVSSETYHFIINTIDSFGRPTEPITVTFRNSRTSADTPL